MDSVVYKARYLITILKHFIEYNYFIQSIFHMKAEDSDNWIPIESDPELWNHFMEKLGMNTEQYHFEELIGLQQWAQALISGPVMGLILLYDQTQKQIQYQKQQQAIINENSKHPNLFYMKQLAHNACGTIAMFHVILNNQHKNDLIKKQSILDSFCRATADLNSWERGKYFQQDKNIRQEHASASAKGQSEVKTEVNEHYIGIVARDGRIYELDGCKKGPIDHGECSQESFLMRGCKLIKQILERDPQNIHCSVIALVNSTL